MVKYLIPHAADALHGFHGGESAGVISAFFKFRATFHYFLEEGGV